MKTETAARLVTLAGYKGDRETVRQAVTHSNGKVRAAALGALVRMGCLDMAQLLHGLEDPVPLVRRKACELVGDSQLGRQRATLLAATRRLLEDGDPLVVDSACWAVGEHADRRAVRRLVNVAGQHPDARCREAAVAALGAVGDPAGLAAVLEALADRPAVRRRAAVALAAFQGNEVDAALRRCLEDRDWQVRQIAEDLLDV